MLDDEEHCTDGALVHRVDPWDIQSVACGWVRVWDCDECTPNGCPHDADETRHCWPFSWGPATCLWCIIESDGP